jgi:hypothetical protein
LLSHSHFRDKKKAKKWIDEQSDLLMIEGVEQVIKPVQQIRT